MSAVAALAATAAPWQQWRFHPEVWLLVGGVIVLGLYVTRVIAPKVVEPGVVAVTRRQKGFFVAGVVMLWVSSDWPMHDVGEQSLFFVHMVQHFLLTMVIPPLFLLAVPTWLVRLVFPEDGAGYRLLHRLRRPTLITIVFNSWVVFTHWQPVVNTSVEVGPLHYLVHTISVALALVMWINVCGPWPEWRLSPPNQCGYLFLQSVIPTIPSAWITMANDTVYKVYDQAIRPWNWSAATDQQYAGLFMKVGAGYYLWTVIIVIFFRWSLSKEQKSQYVTLTREEAARIEAGLPASSDPVTPTGT